jgi:hypothetical protein
MPVGNQIVSMTKTPWSPYGMEEKGGEGVVIYGVFTLCKKVRLASNKPFDILLESQ